MTNAQYVSSLLIQLLNHTAYAGKKPIAPNTGDVRAPRRNQGPRIRTSRHQVHVVTRSQRAQNNAFRVAAMPSMENSDELKVENTFQLAKRLRLNYSDTAPYEFDSIALRALRGIMLDAVNGGTVEQQFRAVVNFTVLEIREDLRNAINVFVDDAAKHPRTDVPPTPIDSVKFDEPFVWYKLLMERLKYTVNVTAHRRGEKQTWDIDNNSAEKAKCDIFSFLERGVVRSDDFESEAIKTAFLKIIKPNRIDPVPGAGVGTGSLDPQHTPLEMSHSST